MFVGVPKTKPFNLELNVTRTLQPVATCRQSPYLHKPAIAIITSLSLWRHSRFSRLRRSQPRSHYDVIRWAGHVQRYWRRLRTDNLPRLIYKDYFDDLVKFNLQLFQCYGTMIYFQQV